MTIRMAHGGRLLAVCFGLAACGAVAAQTLEARLQSLEA
jgi:hypothetical protein